MCVQRSRRWFTRHHVLRPAPLTPSFLQLDHRSATMHLISFASNRCTIYVETQGNSISIFKLGAATVPDFMTWIVGQALVSIVEFHYRRCTAGDEFEGSIVHCSSSQILQRAHLRNTHCFIIEKNDSYRYRCNNQSINRKRDGHSIQRNLEIVLPIW